MKSVHRVLLAAAVLYLTFIARSAFTVGGETYFSLLDDAMISMRYARNLAEGHGLVWNVGGAPIEGYTNFLWIMWMSVIHLTPVPWSKTSLVVMLSGAAILLTNAVVVRAILRRFAPSDESFGVVLGVAMVAFCFSLTFWTLRGMEVGLVVLLVDVGCYGAFLLYERVTAVPAAAFCSSIAMLTLVRDDAALSASVIAAFGICIAVRRRAFGLTAATVAALLVPAGLHLLWRLHYYGDILPNTYYLKMTGVPFAVRIGHGAGVALAMAGRSLVLPLALIIVASVQRRLLLTRDPRLWLLAGLALANIAYSAYVGGDVWDWMRFPNRFATIGLIPLLILGAIATEAIWSQADDGAERLRSIGGAIVLALGAAAVTDLVDKATSFGLASSPAGTSVTLATAAFAGIVALRLRRGDVGPRMQRLFSGKPWVAIVLVLLATDGRFVGQWMLRNALGLADDMRVARLGAFLHGATASDSTMAVAYAGAIPYFADRFSYDLTGKNDRVIAREAGQGPFRPGLNKRDYPYTMLTFRPDVVADAQWAVGDLARLLPGWGYIGLPNGVFVKRDDRRVAWQCIGLDWRLGERRRCAPGQAN